MVPTPAVRCQKGQAQRGGTRGRAGEHGGPSVPLVPAVLTRCHALFVDVARHAGSLCSALASLLPPGFEPAAFPPGVGDLWSRTPPSSGGEQDSGREELTGLLLGPGGNATWN